MDISKNIDQKTLDAIDLYTSSMYEKINTGLLNVSSTDELKRNKQATKLIETELLKHPVLYDTIVYRGVSVDDEKELSVIKFGGKHYVRSFMSTTTNISIAKSLLSSKTCCLLEITLKPGVYAMDIAHLSRLSHEKEVLVLFGGILELKGKRQENHLTIYECEYRSANYTHKHDEFKLMTFNIFNNSCTLKTVKQYINQLSDVEILCTQEDTEDDIFFSNFIQLQRCGSGNEIEKIYYNRFLTNIPEFIECIKDDYHRSAILIRHKGLVIANLHMEGGRYIDTKICTTPIEIQKRKMKLLHNVLEKSPDIILGDFNSVYSSNETQLEEFIETQLNYFRSICDTVNRDDIIKWNKEPFDLLSKYGYVYTIPINEREVITNTAGQTIVDMIWYKNKVCKLENTQIFPLNTNTKNQRVGPCSYSDHNPVFTTVITT